jgi:hypothetical protein
MSAEHIDENAIDAPAEMTGNEQHREYLERLAERNQARHEGEQRIRAIIAADRR